MIVTANYAHFDIIIIIYSVAFIYTLYIFIISKHCISLAHDKKEKTVVYIIIYYITHDRVQYVYADEETCRIEIQKL